MLIILEVIYIKRVISDTDHYLIPGTDKTYYINLDGDVYNIKKQRYISRTGNMISLNKDGIYRKYSCKDLLIDALSAHIEDMKRLINRF